MGIGLRSESGLLKLARHLDQRNFHRFAKVVILVLGAWFGGLMCQRTASDPNLTNALAVILLASLTLWYFVMVVAMVMRPLIRKLHEPQS
jgi:hypothetical protein